MSQAEPVNTTTPLAITQADLNTTVNHEPRVQDLRLGFSLGMKNPASAMRQLIQRHRDALERFGEVSATVEKTSLKGGRPGTTYWLNKRQALYLCTKSETPNATEATIAMVEVFDAHLRGTLAPVRPVTVKGHTRALPKPLPRADPVPPSQPEVEREGFAVMRIGDETLVVDLNRFEVGPDERAVVFDSDGRLTVEKVERPWPRQGWSGNRGATALAARKDPGQSFPYRPGVWVVGAVVTTQTGRQPEKPPVAIKRPTPTGRPKLTRPSATALLGLEALGTA